jgi:hypothetical protein
VTDVIAEKDGKRIYYYIADDHPAIVYVNTIGTFRVKRSKAADLLKSAVENLLRRK